MGDRAGATGDRADRSPAGDSGGAVGVRLDDAIGNIGVHTADRSWKTSTSTSIG
jgi:hypothetical protein